MYGVWNKKTVWGRYHVACVWDFVLIIGRASPFRLGTCQLTFMFTFVPEIRPGMQCSDSRIGGQNETMSRKQMAVHDG